MAVDKLSSYILFGGFDNDNEDNGVIGITDGNGVDDVEIVREKKDVGGKGLSSSSFSSLLSYSSLISIIW